MSSMFDTLDYTKGAEAIGIKREHAEYQAQQMNRLIGDNVATKNDILILKNEMILMEQRIIIKLGIVMVALVTILGIIIKL